MGLTPRADIHPPVTISTFYSIVGGFSSLPLLPTRFNPFTTRFILSMQSIQFLSVLVAVILQSQSATAIVPTFRCTGRGARTAGYCVQPGTETTYLVWHATERGQFYCGHPRFKEGSGACCQQNFPFSLLTPINGIGLIKNPALNALCDVL
ncbi:hypothetical protein Pst134EB_014529 [Puccinia striiformis f. sp. tritici]|nr:hypothetical protein Pst134EB_014529 [Puccinia striiformis f. sp. tritici]